MPKAKADSVSSVRLELQETERDTLKLFLAGKTMTNTLRALSPIVAASVPALIIGAAYLYTKDELEQWWNDKKVQVREMHIPEVGYVYDNMVQQLDVKSWSDYQSGNMRFYYTKAVESLARQPAYQVASMATGSMITGVVNLPPSIRDRLENSIGFMADAWDRNFRSQSKLNTAIASGKSIKDTWIEWWPRDNAINAAATSSSIFWNVGKVGWDDISSLF